MTIMHKRTSYGYVELKEEWSEYRLYVNGVMKKYSKDYQTMVREFNRA